jgi:hypothetical protein
MKPSKPKRLPALLTPAPDEGDEVEEADAAPPEPVAELPPLAALALSEALDAALLDIDTTPLEIADEMELAADET